MNYPEAAYYCNGGSKPKRGRNCKESGRRSFYRARTVDGNVVSDILLDTVSKLVYS